MTQQLHIILLLTSARREAGVVGVELGEGVGAVGEVEVGLGEKSTGNDGRLRKEEQVVVVELVLVVVVVVVLVVVVLVVVATLQ